MSGLRDALDFQLTIGWTLLELHLAGLDDDECLWRPSRTGPYVHHEGGAWTADWPETEDYALGPPSIAWLTWHIGFWRSMVLDHSFGDASLRREDVPWPGSAAEARTWIADLHSRWTEAVGRLGDDDLASTERTLWPFTDRPFHDVMAWLNLELMKNAAEIGYGRFLYATR